MGSKMESNSIEAQVRWCIIRFANNRFERAKDGYRSMENAQKAIPSIAKAYADKGGDRSAMYAVGKYNVGKVIAVSRFCQIRV